MLLVKIFFFFLLLQLNVGNELPNSPKVAKSDAPVKMDGTEWDIPIADDETEPYSLDDDAEMDQRDPDEVAETEDELEDADVPKKTKDPWWSRRRHFLFNDHH